MPINLAGGGRAGGVGDALLEIVKQRLLEQELNQRQQDQELSRRRQDRLDARQADQTNYDRGQDKAAKERQDRLDQEAAGQRTHANQIADFNVLNKGDIPQAQLNASLGSDPSTVKWNQVPTAQGVPETGAPSYAPSPMQSNTMPVGKLQLRPMSMEANDERSAADEKRKLNNSIALENAKPHEWSNETVSQGGKNVLRQVDKYGNVRPAPEGLGPKLPERDPAAGAARDDARMDRSYQYNVSELREMRKPVQDRAERLGRLAATVNEQTPQADALVAPELMTVMAGGMGSGLRINEAEIERVLGGRTNLEAVKAALNKWKIHPEAGLSITPAQRAQISSLMDKIQGRVREQIRVIGDGLNQMNDAGSVEDHRRILAETQKKYDAISLGDNGPAPTAGKPDVNSIINEVLSGKKGGG